MLTFPPRSGGPLTLVGTNGATSLPKGRRENANNNNNSAAVLESGSRVWVKQAAIDAATNKPSRFSRKSSSASNSNSNKFSAAALLHANDSSVSSLGDTESCTDSSALASSSRHHLSWEWKPAVLLENAKGKLVVRLNETNTQLELPATSWEQQWVVTANELPTDPDTGAPLPPHDLISLTHLHEPAVVESLQHRFGQDRIYTSTGPVLLALNPFQTLRGLYGETIQKRYWERAENNVTSSRSELPPHVYAIADASFRNMMRSLEDAVGTTTADGNKSSSCNQSILVSGESGAGKTVTTKFVMKYLAALSQRSAFIAQTPAKRAYQQAAAKSGRPTSVQRMSPSKTKAMFGAGGSSWVRTSTAHTMTPTSAPRRSMSNVSTASSSGADLATVTTSLNSSSSTSAAGGNSIEAQVLQSNPILESFGNARTIRNDNSSRFGKFIEIQFAQNGKLVGAQIDTYLLEKVRLLRQAHGERNYHIFYELLSGSLSAAELSQFFLASTATPHDFKMTCQSGTYTRRDGVRDADTCRQLLTAFQTMQFSAEEMASVLSVTAAILHASNLTFCHGGTHGEAQLDTTNVHLQPVCHLLGVAAEDLNEALCAHTIQAAQEQCIRRSLTVPQAEKGLEALLKTVYGALFQYLVQRINDSIAFENTTATTNSNSDAASPGHQQQQRPAASIGVLDIFGFESFQSNSFEQLCINYCNEALQQQFNAFVLKNEQAEYESEGIEWSFIEFPENQDVLDLIEKRGTGILSLLDDQCRAPGPSDKAFCLGLYQTCQSHGRFQATRQQTAGLQFSVQHYAGLVEYTSAGFVEKNRDELPKETVDMLCMSDSPIVQELAALIEATSTTTTTTAAPRQLRRADSAVGRATVGGQFRRQLRDLRNKIDVTTPHYIRCIKPNDMLVPDVFDAAIVADQLRCGGILEAIRVARAGFTQHYPHADFIRRYRSIAWSELGAAGRKRATSLGANSPSSSRGGGGGWKNGSNSRKSFSSSSYRPGGNKEPAKQEKTPAEVKAECKSLVTILYRKVCEHEYASGTFSESGGGADASPSSSGSISPSAKAKTYSYRSSSSSTPSWSKERSAPENYAQPTPAKKSDSKKKTPSSWIKATTSTPEPQPKKPPSPPKTTWKRGGLTSADYLKVGIQMGKSKVFLRHKCFEILERLRSQEQTKAATKLNSIFRRYLARIAYLPFRNAFRHELRERRRMFEQGSEYDEKKEMDDMDSSSSSRNYFLSRQSGNFAKESLVDKWMESQIRDAIHNPIPRHEWGKQAPSGMQFLWLLDDGVWVKNYNISSSPTNQQQQTH